MLIIYTLLFQSSFAVLSLNATAIQFKGSSMCNLTLTSSGTANSAYVGGQNFSAGLYKTALSTPSVGDHGINCVLTVNSNPSLGIQSAWCDYITINKTSDGIVRRGLEPSLYPTLILKSGNENGGWQILIQTPSNKT